MSKAPIHPKHPERICWGCEKFCPATHLNCRETRVEHPCELFGEDWLLEIAPAPTVRGRAVPPARSAR